MSHAIPVPKTRTQPVVHSLVEGNIEVTCFPDGRVIYKLQLKRCDSAIPCKIKVWAVFYSRGRRTGNFSQQAMFSSRTPVVQGVPPGNGAYVGVSFPSDSAIYAVDDFAIGYGVLKGR